MSQPCTAPKCERTSRALCDCCKQKLCLQHLTEHNESLMSQLHPLTDEINSFADRLKTFDIHKRTRNARQELEGWRKDCYQKIDRFFEQKCQELDRISTKELNKQRDKILQVQSKAAKLIQQQEATLSDIDVLVSTIRQLEKQMDNIEGTYVQVNIHSLKLDDSLIRIVETDAHVFDLSVLSNMYATLDYSADSWVALASNDQLLLVHQHPNLCLVNKEGKIVKRTLWQHGTILDMCWSRTLSRFIVLEENKIFFLDNNTMSVNNVETTEERVWQSCACSNAFLFVSTCEWSSSILKFSFTSPMTVLKEWKHPVTCAKAECIDDIACNSENIAVLIGVRNKGPMRMELRTCEALDRIWSLQLDTVTHESIRFRCCSLNHNEWLIADHVAHRLLNITKDGQQKTAAVYNGIPRDAELFADDVLVISTSKGINFHKI